MLTARCTFRTYDQSSLQHFTLNLEVKINLFHIYLHLQFSFCTILNWGRLPGISTEHECSKICSISHFLKVGIIILHICIFHLRFLFWTMLNWSPASRCANRSRVQSISQYFTSWAYSSLHICIFNLQFLFCTILKWSPAARCADHVSHQFSSKKQPIIIFAICVLYLVFCILHF